MRNHGQASFPHRSLMQEGAQTLLFRLALRKMGEAGVQVTDGRGVSKASVTPLATALELPELTSI